MFKKLIMLVILVLGFFVIFPASSLAKTYYQPVKTVIPTPTSAPIVDSFSIFWPMVAGKTMQSKVYFLKTLKENVRGFFIFGSAQKADYDIFLGIKRMLEAEVLMKGDVSDLANKTLDIASKDLDKANSELTSAKNSGNIDQNTKDEINMRVSNLKKFVNSLIVQYPSFKTNLQPLLDKLNSITL